MSKQINIRISDKQADALAKKAEIFGMSVTEYVRFIIAQDLLYFMQEREDKQNE